MSFTEWRALVAAHHIPRSFSCYPPVVTTTTSERRRTRKPRIAPPDGLRTMAEAAARLGCSEKTLKGHVKACELQYVVIGHGMKRPRKMFADADINAFIAAKTRKESPCPSDAIRAARSGTTTSKSTVVAFSARPSAPTSGKRRP
jgi:hypothetical protein